LEIRPTHVLQLLTGRNTLRGHVGTFVTGSYPSENVYVLSDMRYMTVSYRSSRRLRPPSIGWGGTAGAIFVLVVMTSFEMGKEMRPKYSDEIVKNR
jgi:hypothetical protein